MLMRENSYLSVEVHEPEATLADGVAHLRSLGEVLERRVVVLLHGLVALEVHLAEEGEGVRVSCVCGSQKVLHRLERVRLDATSSLVVQLAQANLRKHGQR